MSDEEITLSSEKLSRSLYEIPLDTFTSDYDTNQVSFQQKLVKRMKALQQVGHGYSNDNEIL